MVMRIPLFIQSLGPATHSEWETVETVMVSLHGGMLRVHNRLKVGDVLDIRVRDKDRMARARVVWTSAESTPNGIELGFEILDEEGFWQINFPPDRWSERNRPRKDDGGTGMERDTEREISMLVRDFMTTDITTLQESDTLLDAAIVFVRSSFRHLPVLRDKQLVGIITERDVKQFAPSLLGRTSADEYNQIMETTPISRVMSRELMTLRPDQSMSEAAEILHSKRIGCLPVVEEGELVGLITTTDLVGLLIQIMREKGL
jgi:CBS domain-containing protein